MDTQTQKYTHKHQNKAFCRSPNILKARPRCLYNGMGDLNVIKSWIKKKKVGESNSEVVEGKKKFHIARKGSLIVFLMQHRMLCYAIRHREICCYLCKKDCRDKKI